MIWRAADQLGASSRHVLSFGKELRRIEKKPSLRKNFAIIRSLPLQQLPVIENVQLRSIKYV